MANKAVFDFSQLSASVRRYMPAVDAGVDLAMDSMVPIAETYMRENAPWTDRTANARNGLQAAHVAEPMVQHELVVYHTMPYGIWLEVRWSGRYAILAPTIKAIGPDLMARIVAAIDRAISLL